jgi:manganese/zinc/iron transport system substrate-binding protein
MIGFNNNWKIILLALLIALNTACNSTSDKANGGKLSIVTTTGMIADIAKNIGQDSINVTALMGPGVDPHLYKATQGDLGRLRGADIILYNGLHLEGKMGEVFEKLERIKTVIPISRNIPQERLRRDTVFQGAIDPHIWFDVSLWIKAAEEVTAVLKKEDVDNAPFYEVNSRNYIAELKILHNWVMTQVATIPDEFRILITAHDAFSYFGLAYNMRVRGLQGISTLSEFGLKDRVDLVNYIVEKKIKAVFVETSVSEKNINAIIEGCQKKGHDVKIGGYLFSDAMGADGTPEGTYQGMVRKNVNTIVNALK